MSWERKLLEAGTVDWARLGSSLRRAWKAAKPEACASPICPHFANASATFVFYSVATPRQIRWSESVAASDREGDQRMTSKRLNRRELIGAMGAAGAAVALGCGSSPTSPSSTATTTTTTTGTNAVCAVTPTETIGPFPSLTDLFRSDIREGKTGTLLTLTVKVVNASNGCAAVPNANVEIWHVDAAGNYSQYGSQTTQTYLRGIQTSDANGEVKFTTIYPGWYQGRATHIHLEVTMNGRSVKATQIAFPEAVNNTVHATGVVRLARFESDVERLGRNLCRQPVVGANHADGRRDERVRGDVPGRDFRLSHGCGAWPRLDGSSDNRIRAAIRADVARVRPWLTAVACGVVVEVLRQVGLGDLVLDTLRRDIDLCQPQQSRSA